jgi:hypothetical protein
LHGVGDVELSEHQVLYGVSDAPKLGGVLDRRAKICSKLHLEVNRSRARLAVSHGLTLDYVQCVGVLVEEQPI